MTPARTTACSSAAPAPSSTPATIRRALTRIAHEILERNKGADDLVARSASPPAASPSPAGSPRRIADDRGHRAVPVGALDITMYRDDLRLRSPPGRWSAPTSRTAASTAGSSSWSTTCSSPAAPSGRPSTRCGDLGRPARRPARRAGRPGPPRAADPRRLRRQEPADLAARARARAGSTEDDGVDEVRSDRRDADAGGGGPDDAPPALGRRPRPRRRRCSSSTPPRRWPADRSAARSRSCRPCAAGPSSTSSSRTPPAPGSPSRPPPSGCPPTSSTSRPRAPASPRARASRTPR